MRQTISGLIAAVAVMTASAVPAMACGGGLFGGGGSPCGQTYVSPCAQAYVPAPVYTGCNTGCGGYGYGGYGYDRLSDPVQQYYYVNQGPTYSGPGAFAPYPTYQEGTVSGWDGYRRRSSYHGYGGGRYATATTDYYGGAGVEGPEAYSYRARPQYRPAYRGYRDSMRPSVRYGYAPQRSYAPRYYGQRERVLRRYY